MKRKRMLFTYREPIGKRSWMLTLPLLIRIVEVAVVTGVDVVADVEEAVVREDSVVIVKVVTVVDSVGVIASAVKVASGEIVVVIVSVARVLHYPGEEVVIEVVVDVEEVIEEVVEQG